MDRLRFTCALRFGFASLLCTLAAKADFSVSGRRILKDGTPFLIKGVCYNPTPIGDNGSRAPNGDYYTSAYSAIWDRDLPKLRAMGANVIRIYGWAPTADHTAFLNRCYNNGDHPIYVLVNYWVDPTTDWANATSLRALKTNFTNIESRLGNHPAVLGLIIGNEVNAQAGNGWKAPFWQAMNSVSTAIHELNGKRLVSVAITDSMDHMAWADPMMPNIDFWCMQLYRGTSFGSFFRDFAARSSRPVVLSEYGFDAFNHAASTPYPNNGAVPADIVANLWIEIVGASATCAGGCVFEYCDEWFRAPGTDTTQDPGGWYVSGFPDGYADEEWWGLFSIARNGTGPNLLTPRAAYDELSALWNSAPPPTAPPPLTAPSPLSNGSFESVKVGADGFYAFVYNPTVDGWTFNGNAGITGNNSGFTSGNPAAPDGSQVAFVQMQGWIGVSATLSAGTYTISAKTANRANYGPAQTVVVTVDGNEVGRFTGGTNYVVSTTAPFSVTAGPHEIRFLGQATGDATLFLDQVTVQSATSTRVLVSSNGFESPAVGANTYNAFRYNPATVSGAQEWTFEGYSGVTGNNSGFTSGNPWAPEGGQVAFVQMNTGVVSQVLTFPTRGNYQVSLKAAQRGLWNQSRQVVQVYLDDTRIGAIAPTGTAYETLALPVSTTAGSHKLSFRGTATDDSTVFLDRVEVVSAP